MQSSVIYKNSVRTSQETHYVSATEPNRLMLFRETVAVYCENHTEHMNTLCGQNAEFCYMYKSSPYLTGNTLHLRYRAQPVNAVWETVAVYWEKLAEPGNSPAATGQMLMKAVQKSVVT
jgi:neutral trehalase